MVLGFLAAVADLAHRTLAAPVQVAQVVEFALLAYLQVHNALQARCEPARRRRLVGTSLGCAVVPPYPPVAKVREEVVADVLLRELDRRGVVEGAPRDRAASGVGAAVPVGVEWRLVLRACYELD